MQNYGAGKAAGLRFYVEEQGGEAAVLRATADQREENRKRGFIVEVGFHCTLPGSNVAVLLYIRKTVDS